MARRLTRAIGCDPAGAVNQGEIGLLLREHRLKIAERVRMVNPTPQPSRFRARYSAICPTTFAGGTSAASSPYTRLGDDQAEIVSQAVVEPTAPMRGGVGVTESGLHPDL